ncbi:MAG: HAD hydrolase-like protein [Clostridia bacterium]|nr:HAD hydrolase-like protein [Clostridia bacterium]
MLYRHFFWDFDGTLYDTYGRITRACLKGLRDLGIEASYEEVYALCKRTLEACARAFSARFEGVQVEDILTAYRVHAEEESIDAVGLYPGVREMLKTVVQQGGRNYLFTHRGESAFKFLGRDGIEGLFADTVTSLDGFARKPAPDGLNYLVAKYHLDVKNCIMLGDRDIDLDSGKNAGMACALFDPENFYPDYDTPFRFRDMDTLRKTLTGEK